MSHITKIVAVENATAIWEYDPNLAGNHVLGGNLDVIAAIRTIAIKIQVSSQQIEYFQCLQIQCGFSNSLKIPLHSNIHWGSAYNMLECAYMLRKVSLISHLMHCSDQISGHQSLYLPCLFPLRTDDNSLA